MLVKATNKYQELNVEDKELKRVPKEGETFEVSEDRFKVLSKDNKFKVAFVEEVKTTKIETATKKVKTERDNPEIARKYKGKRWQRLRKQKIIQDPFCERCLEKRNI